MPADHARLDSTLPDPIGSDYDEAVPHSGDPCDIVFPFDQEPPGPPEEPQKIVFPPSNDPTSTEHTRSVGVNDLETGLELFAMEEIEPTIDAAMPSLSELLLVEVRALMERPFFALAGKPLPQLSPYTDPTASLRLQVTAADPTLGVATLSDADLLIVLTSLMNANRGPGGRVDPQISLPATTWLQLCRRMKGGRQHRLLEGSLNRLAGTRITTNIGPDGKPGPTRSFSLLADWSRQGRYGLTLTASDWLVQAVEMNALLSLNRSYFDLPQGYLRWLYRIARKHAGKQGKGFTMRISTLRMKSGATSPLSRFRFELKRHVAEDRLPDYRLIWIAAKAGREAMIEMRYEPNKTPWPLAQKIQECRTAHKEGDGVFEEGGMVLEEELPF